MASKEELPNCRIFIGNLASEKTSKEEIARIFGKYGQIVEEPVLRKSFGFVQYNNPQSAIAAINGENGRLIGGLRIDLNLADNREPKRRNADSYDNRRDKDDRNRGRGRSPPGPKRKRTDADDDHNSKRLNTNNVNTARNLPVLCQVFFLTYPQKGYAQQIEDTIMREVGSFSVQCMHVNMDDVPQYVTRAENSGMRYVCVVGRQAEARGSLDLYIFRPGRQPELLKKISISNAMDTIRREEQRIASTFLQNIDPNLVSLLQQNQLGQVQLPNLVPPTQSFLPPTQLPLNVSLNNQLQSQQQLVSLTQGLSQPQAQQQPLDIYSIPLSSFSPASPPQQPQNLQAFQQNLPQTQFQQQNTQPSYQSSSVVNIPPSQRTMNYPTQPIQRTAMQQIQQPQVMGSVPMMSTSVQNVSMPVQTSSLAHNVQQLQQSMLAPASGSVSQGGNNVATLLNPRNTEILQSLLAKLGGAVPQSQPQNLNAQSLNVQSQLSSAPLTSYPQQGQQNIGLAPYSPPGKSTEELLKEQANLQANVLNLLQKNSSKKQFLATNNQQQEYSPNFPALSNNY